MWLGREEEFARERLSEELKIERIKAIAEASLRLRGAGNVPKTRTSPANMAQNEGDVPKNGTSPAQDMGGNDQSR